MKLLLLTTCLVVSVFAAPTEKTKRNILPGDDRYDAKLHQHHGEHGPQENEVEISKALGGFTGTFFQSETGNSLGGVDSLKHGIDADKAAGAVKSSDSKDVEQDKSLPKVESAPAPKPSVTPGSDVTTSTDFDVASRSQVSDAEKESTKNADDIKVEAKSTSDVSSSDASKTTSNSATIDAKSPAEAFSSDLGLATDSLAPFFDSDFKFGFPSVGQSDYIPSFQSSKEYTPSFDGFNTNYEFSNNYGAGSPLDLTTYSGFDQGFNGQIINSQIPVDSSQLNPISSSKNVPYLPPSSFHSLASISEATNPSEFNFNLEHSYLSPSLEQPKHQFVSTVGSQDQQELFKNYSPFNFAQPTSGSFQAPFQPEIRLTEGSYSGGSQLTDTNGGYVY